MAIGIAGRLADGGMPMAIGDSYLRFTIYAAVVIEKHGRARIHDEP